MDITDMLLENGGLVAVLNWWGLLGLEKYMPCSKMRQENAVDGDGVHLTDKANRIAAVSKCHRLTGARGSGATDLVKRPRWNTAK